MKGFLQKLDSTQGDYKGAFCKPVSFILMMFDLLTTSSYITAHYSAYV